jgi:iron complex outermembrane receptor protein
VGRTGLPGSSLGVRMQKNDKIASPRLAAAVAAALGVATASTPASAQQAYTDDGAPLETIIVTATRRDANVQDVPFNMAALSQDAIDDLRITNLAELTRAVPGLYVPNQGPRGANLLTVRGLNVTSMGDTTLLGNGTGGTVATYLGDIPVYVDLKMIDIERVETLLGPQGTLYGQGTLAGAIRYLPNRPDPAQFEAEAAGRVYSVGQSDGLGSQVWGAVNVPLVTDRLALRVAAGHFDDPGFVDYDYVVREPGVSNPNAPFDGSGDDVPANLRRHEDVDTEETLTARVGLFWQATDALSANLTYYYQDQEVGGRTVGHDAALGTGRHVSAMRLLEPNDKSNDLVALEVTWDAGFAELTSATGWSKFESKGRRDQTDFLMDLDYGYEDFPSFAAYTNDELEEESINQELRLVSQGTEKWNWILGAYYNRYEADALAEEFAPGYYQWAFPDEAPADYSGLEYQEISDREFTETAVFGELGYRITDRWQVTVGVRWFDYEDELSRQVGFPFFGDVSLDQRKVGDDETIFKLNTSYEFTPDVMGYLTVSEGYRTGGINLGPPCPDPVPDEQTYCLMPDEILIAPDTTTNFEAGLRSRWFDGRLLLNAAVYLIEWNEPQVLSTSEIGALPITVNGGGAETRGVELTTRWSITDALELAASFAYADAQLTSDAEGLVDGENAFDGDRLAGSPETQGALLLDYTRPLANGWTLNGNYSLTAVGDVYTKVGLRSGGEALPGYAVHGVSLGVSNGPWSATLYADNVWDKYAVTSVRRDRTYIRAITRLDWDTPDPDDEIASIPSRTYYQSMLRPRTVGLEFAYRFDL